MAKNKKRRLTVGPKGGHAAPKSITGQRREATLKKPTIPFDAEQQILLVGEGDFSFARAIVEHHGCCNVTATCLDAKVDLFAKYSPQAEENIGYLEQEGQIVLYEINATNLEKHKALRTEKFDCIMFNFPHVGGKSTDVNRQVRFNQELLFKFFQSAAGLLANQGSIVVTLFEGEPYTLWNIRDLARSRDLIVDRSFSFTADAYPGYKHARTLGNIDGGGGWKGMNRNSRSYMFKAKEETSSQPLSPSARRVKKRKKAHESDSDEDG